MDPAQVGPFEILGALGEGGMGRVFRARDTRLDRLVAIKLLPEARGADADARARFIKEAKAASALNHPHIVTIYEVGEHDGQTFIAMELVDGRPLNEVIGGRPIKLKEALRVAADVADALAAAHKAGIVHRDLKPANIVIGSDGRAKVLDFGLAKQTTADAPLGADQTTQATPHDPTLTEGTILGSVPYMSPEQAEGRPVDARSDIFSFGAVLYEMATGQRAFRGDSRASTLAAVVEKDPTSITTITKDVPPELERLIGRCLRKDLQRRSQSMADVKLALDELREESESGRLSASGATPVRASSPWRTAGVIAAVAVGVVGLAAAAWTWFGGRPATPAAMSIAKLATIPDLEDASVSPDQRYLAFVENTAGMYRLVVRQLATGTDLELVRPQPASLRSPQLSRDGNYVFCLEENWQVKDPTTTILQVATMGGGARRLATVPDAVLGFAVSWDGRQLAWTQPASSNAGTNGSVIIIANGDGTKRREFATLKEMLYSLAWSPDGRHLAAPTSDFSTSELFIFSTADGSRQSLNAMKWPGSRTWPGCRTAAAWCCPRSRLMPI